MKNTGKIGLLGTAFVLGLVGCGGESAPQTSNAFEVQPIQSTKEKPVASKIEAPKPDYLFERHSYNCIGNRCELSDAPVKYTGAEFTTSLTEFHDITVGMSTAGLREAISDSYSGGKSSELGNTTEQSKYYTFHHLRPGYSHILNEYESYYTYTNESNKVIEWGARVRCAPVEPHTPWQIETCVPAVYDFIRPSDPVEGCNVSPCSQVMKYSDYDQNLAEQFGFKSNTSLGRITSPMVRSGFSFSKKYDVDKKIVNIVTRPQKAGDHEYDIYLKLKETTEPPARGAESFVEWGARVRCAPITATTPWQTTPC